MVRQDVVRCGQEAGDQGAGRGGGQQGGATSGNVLFGWQEEDAVYAGTGRRVVQRLAKASGAVEASYQCDAAVYSCATSSVYCFTADGTRL